MTDIAEVTPNIDFLPKQERFTMATQFHPDAKFIWYVGWFWSWKTFIWCYNAILLALRYPWNRWLIARQTLVDLKATTQITFFEVLEEVFELKEWENWVFDKSNSVLYIKTWDDKQERSTIIFSWLDEISKIKGMELGFFYVDEVDSVKEEVFMTLRWRLRNKKAKRRVWFITSNSEWKNWTYQIFIWGKRIPEEARKNYFTFKASSLENKFLPSDYIETLMSFDWTLFDRYVLWEFNIFEWQVYPEFDPSINVIQPFTINPERWWQPIYWHDHWSYNPTSFLEWWIDFDWNLYITWEHYKSNTKVEDHANIVKQRRSKLWLKNTPETISDPSTFNKTQQPNQQQPFPFSVADQYAEHWIWLIPWNNNVLAGIDRVKEYLWMWKILIFRNCSMLIEEMEKYARAKDSSWYSLEKPVKRNDHSVDALRYIIMTKFPPAYQKTKAGYNTIEDLVKEDIKSYNSQTEEDTDWQ